MSLVAKHAEPNKSPHIPAWKRFGLKLKFAKEFSENHTSEERSHDHEKGQNISVPAAREVVNTAEQVRPQKKRKVSHGSPRDTKQSPSHSLLQSSAKSSRNEASTERTSEAETLAISRRKSVTFAPETEQDDSFAVSPLFNEWDLELANTNLDTPSGADAVESSKLLKKQKKRNRASADQATFDRPSERADSIPQSKGEPDYVRYLRDFHDNRSSWKFNKKKQTEVLKHLFDFSRLPPDLDAAILHYLSGLQGAGARQRVIESATEVLKALAKKESGATVEEDMETGDARRAAYSAALRRQIELFEKTGVGSSEHDDQAFDEMKQEIQRGQRAEAVLSELLQKELQQPSADHLEPNAQQVVTEEPPHIANARRSIANGASHDTIPISKRKKRKSRTQGLSNDSSSESEDDSKRARGPATVHDALAARSDPTVSAHPAKAPSTKWGGTKKVFDDDLLDQMFPKRQSYHATAPKRRKGDQSKARGFAYTHGTKADESASDDDD